MLSKDPVVVALNTNSKKLQELSEKLVEETVDQKPESVAIQYPILSKDVVSYTETVKNISERWQTCKVCVAERLVNFCLIF